MTRGAEKTFPPAPLGPETDHGKSSVRRLAAGAGVTLGGRIVGRGLDLLRQVSMARLLGPEIFGLYAIGWNLISILVPLVLVGLPSALIRFASPYWRRDHAVLKGVILSTFSVAAVTSVLATIALFLAAPWLAVSVFKEPQLTAALRWFALGVPMVAGLRLLATATRVSQRMQYAVYAQEVGQTALNLVLFLLFFVAGWLLSGAVVATVLSFGLAVVLSFYYLLRLFPELLTVPAKFRVSFLQLMAFSLPTAVSDVFGMLVGRMDRVLLGFFRPAAEVGIYQAAAPLAMLFSTIVLGSFNAILSPMIADLYEHGQIERLQGLYRTATKWALYVTLPLFLVFAFASHEIMQVAFGAEYTSGALPLLVLSIGQLVNVATGAVGYLLLMTGRQNRWLAIISIMLVIDIVLNATLIPPLGQLGAALSTTVTVCGLYIVGLFDVRSQLKLWPYDRRYFKGAIAAILTVAALVLVRILISAPALLMLALLAATSATVFFGALFIAGPDEDDRELIELVRAKVGF